jgi:hypothetical protein
MTPPYEPLESARLKSKAHDHLRAFNDGLKRFREGDPYPVSRQLDRGGAEHVYRVEIRQEPPPYLGTIVGDVLHNLRSALDSIVYDLSLTASLCLTPGQRASTGFPIAADPEKFKPCPIRFLSPSAQAQVRAAQPYESEAPLLNPLWMIGQLNNVDKHRRVLVVPAFSMGSIHTKPTSALPKGRRLLDLLPLPWVRSTAAPLDFDERLHAVGPFQTGAELARFTFSEPQPEVDMEFQPMFDVALGDRTRAGSLELREAVTHVEQEILPRFEGLV